jgi:KDO2-lipid IV(A) lauroyltransferase
MVTRTKSKVSYQGVGVYKISNKYFDKLIRQLRSKYTELVTTNKTIPNFSQSKNGILSIYGLASDQSQKQDAYFIGTASWG